MRDTSKYICAAMVLAFAAVACDRSTPIASDPGDNVEYPRVDFTQGFSPPGALTGALATEVVAWFPAQVSWQWLTDNIAHSGATALGAGTPCTGCHAGQETALGRAMVASDPEPIQGKDPYKRIQVQAAYDHTNLYLRVQWESERPGITHQMFRWDGEAWVPGTTLKPNPLGPNQIYSYEDRFAVIFDDAEVQVPAYDGASVGYREAGCFITCHTSMRDMPQDAPGDQVRAHPYLGQEKGRSDIRKYLLLSREPGAQHRSDGAWAEVKSVAELDQLLEAGRFLDLWQFRGARSAPMQKASDDFVLEYRWSGLTGRNAWFDQIPDDGRFTTGDWMYDESALGFRAIPVESFEEWLEEAPLVTEGPHRNAVPFDPGATFLRGDLLPRRVLRQATGSRGDVNAYGLWSDGKWTVTFVRALDTGNPDDHAFVAGGIHSISLAVFDDHTTSRRHYVTFPVTLGLGVDADIAAVPVGGSASAFPLIPSKR